MSVINQMLKDLEQRTPEQGQAVMPITINQKPLTVKIVLISLIVLVSLNLLGFYIWNLQAQVTSSNLKLKEQEAITNASDDLSRQSIKTLDREVLERQELIPANASLTDTKVNLATALVQQAMVKDKANVPEPSIEHIVTLNPVTIKPLVQIEPVLAKRVSPELINPPAESKMSVSRRHLTSEELVLQKIARAEKAIKINDVMKAEQLFEEVLIVAPNHKQARKNLAALWFGRKAYKQATNLLSQGISLDKSDAELRLLKARIHLQQGQHQSAYNTLKPQSTLKQQEYQVMLANVSQQIEQYESAIQAYKILIDMQAYSGRWHLGLAIVYDKSSQFPLAATEYAIALTKSDLSVVSAEFAQQRMTALGE